MLRRKPKEKKGSKNEMKKTLCMIIGIIAAIAMLAGCAAESTTTEDATTPDETAAVTDTTTTDDTAATTTDDAAATTTDDAAAATTDDAAATTEEVVYVGEYTDNDGTDCKLEIAESEEEAGKYIVQLGIYRLVDLDGTGEVTEEGLAFTAIDPADGTIGGVITIDGDKATVTFTDSTWEYIANGDSFEYTKTSDTPTIQTAE